MFLCFLLTCPLLYTKAPIVVLDLPIFYVLFMKILSYPRVISITLCISYKCLGVLSLSLTYKSSIYVKWILELGEKDPINFLPVRTVNFPAPFLNGLHTC